jgi:selenide,water dikinase
MQRPCPLLPQARALVEQGFVTGASGRNRQSYGAAVTLARSTPDWQRHLLTDPQTSGGLLVACSAPRAEALRQTTIAAGYPHASVVGEMRRGEPGVEMNS